MRGAYHLSNPWVTPWLKRSTLHRDGKPSRAGNPVMTVVYMNLQPPNGTACRSPDNWWSLTPPSHPYCQLSGGGCFLLPSSAVANSFHFQKWSALCCPDFPLATIVASGRAGTLFPVQNYYFFFKYESFERKMLHSNKKIIT